MKPRYQVLSKIQMTMVGKQGESWESSVPKIWITDMTDVGGVGTTGDYSLYLNLMAVKIGKPGGRKYKPTLIEIFPVFQTKAYPMFKKDMKKKGGKK